MSLKHLKRLGRKITLFGCLLAIFIYLFFASFGWIVTCGIVKLITLCFGWTFSWAIATGVWLIMVLIHAVFPSK